MHRKTGILKNIQLRYSPVETMKLLQKLWGMSLMDAKKLIDHVLKYKELDLQSGFRFCVNGVNTWKYNLNPDVVSHIFDGDFIQSDKEIFSFGLVISKNWH